MTRLRNAAALLVPAAVVVAIAVRVLRTPVPPLEPPPPYALADGRVTFVADAKMLSRLEIVEIAKAAQESTEFRSVGQIVALSNTSGNLVGNPVGWVELDPKLTASLGLKLPESAGESAGVAYGLTSLAAEYAERVEPGQRLKIMRYGLRASDIFGDVVKVIPRQGGDSVDVVFRLSRAQDWFPGTNCEVVFPVLRGRPVRIPTTAPVHIGTQEYVWKEEAPGRFVPQNVSLVDATADDASVLGLKPGDRIVARGAILLKPLLEPLLAQKRG